MEKDRRASRAASWLVEKPRQSHAIAGVESYETAGRLKMISPRDSSHRQTVSFVTCAPPSHASGSLIAMSSTAAFITFSPAGVIANIVFGGVSAVWAIVISGTGLDA